MHDAYLTTKQKGNLNIKLGFHGGLLLSFSGITDTGKSHPFLTVGFPGFADAPCLRGSYLPSESTLPAVVPVSKNSRQYVIPGGFIHRVLAANKCKCRFRDSEFLFKEWL